MKLLLSRVQGFKNSLPKSSWAKQAVCTNNGAFGMRYLVSFCDSMHLNAGDNGLDYVVKQYILSTDGIIFNTESKSYFARNWVPHFVFFFIWLYVFSFANYFLFIIIVIVIVTSLVKQLRDFLCTPVHTNSSSTDIWRTFWPWFGRIHWQYCLIW